MGAELGHEIERSITDDHAHQASFLWLFRERAVVSPDYDVADLRDLDDRLDAHLDGLRVTGDLGYAIALAAAGGKQKKDEKKKKNADIGATFVAAVLAIERWDLRALARLLDATGVTKEGSREIAAALGWVPFETTRKLLRGLFASHCPPPLHWLGVTACATHRSDPGAPLGFAVLSGDRRLRSRALRAAGEIGRSDLLGDLRATLKTEDEGLAFSAAWSAAVLGDQAALPVLFRIAKGGGPYAERAATTAARRMDGATALSELRALGSLGYVRAAIAGAAALGDAAAVPWLFEAMEAPETARLAGGALRQITGVDLVAERLAAKPPKGFDPGPTEDPDDEDVAMDPDEGLPFPDPALVRAWWSRRAGDFKRQTRYLLGRPMDPAWLEEVLKTGRQPERASAAIELSMRERGRPVFEVRAPGDRQMRALGRG
jgi:uncharacterized protein (TIGR02270 family)